jgi:hypothetical protein
LGLAFPKADGMAQLAECRAALEAEAPAPARRQNRRGAA